MGYKLVALDVDGTLLNSQGKIPARHKEIIQRAQESGIHVVLATGRYYMQTVGIIDELNYQGILVTNDGSLIVDAKSKQIIKENSFSINDVSSFIKACQTRDIQFAVVTAFNYYIETISKEHVENCEKHGVIYSQYNDILNLSESVMKFSIMDTSKVGGWQDQILPANLRIRIDGEFWKEYMHCDATKTNGLKEILHRLNINSSEMIAIGDFYNDLDMIEYAGMGIAMGNAPEDVKVRADDVTFSNDEDGVYHALTKCLF